MREAGLGLRYGSNSPRFADLQRRRGRCRRHAGDDEACNSATAKRSRPIQPEHVPRSRETSMNFKLTTATPFRNPASFTRLVYNVLWPTQRS